tara:strand:+ start:124 stop:972 length:849 start_codon:yes stop_codon:yes gene_type:complete
MSGSLNSEDFTEMSSRPSYDLADHFLACAKLGRYLTIATGARFIITDDLRGDTVHHEAAAVAAIFSRDSLVAEAALLPLCQSIPLMDHGTRDKYERLFHLIVKQSLSQGVRGGAQSLIESRFRAGEIRNLEAQLGGKLSPARVRYRDFLTVVKKLMDRNISERAFVDEFKEFTLDIAGKLDFGIYSFCLDSLFRSLEVPISVKKRLSLELVNYPPLIRRELMSNLLAYPGQTRDLVIFVSTLIERNLEPEKVVEIELLKNLKLQRFSMAAVNALVEKSHVIN